MIDTKNRPQSLNEAWELVALPIVDAHDLNPGFHQRLLTLVHFYFFAGAASMLQILNVIEGKSVEEQTKIWKTVADEIRAITLPDEVKKPKI